MPQTVELPDARTVEFPDDFTPEQMNAEILHAFPKFAPGSPLSPSVAPPGQSAKPARPASNQIVSGVQATPAESVQMEVIANAPKVADIMARYRAHPEEFPIYEVDIFKGVNVQVPKVTSEELETLGLPSWAAKAGAGAQQGIVQSLVEPFLSDWGVATLGIGPFSATAQKAIAAGFVGQMASQSPEQLKEIYSAYKAGDLERATRATIGATGNLLFTGAGIHSLTHRPTYAEAVGKALHQQFADPETVARLEAESNQAAADTALAATLRTLRETPLTKQELMLEMRARGTRGVEIQEKGPEIVAPEGVQIREQQRAQMTDELAGLSKELQAARIDGNGQRMAEIRERMTEIVRDLEGVARHFEEQPVRREEIDLPTAEDLLLNRSSGPTPLFGETKPAAEPERLPVVEQPEPAEPLKTAAQAKRDRQEEQSVQPSPEAQSQPPPTPEPNPTGKPESVVVQSEGERVSPAVPQLAETPLESGQKEAKLASELQPNTSESTTGTQARSNPLSREEIEERLTRIEVERKQLLPGLQHTDPARSSTIAQLRYLDGQEDLLRGLLNDLSDLQSPAVRTATTLSPESQRLGITAPSVNFLANFHNFGEGLLNYTKTGLKGLAGESAPRTTAADREAGELLVRWASANIAAPYAARAFTDEVVGPSPRWIDRVRGKSTQLVDDVKFGAALTEDNLRSIKDAFQRKAAQARADAATHPNANTSYLEDAQRYDAAANSVITTIGARNSPFRTEAEYQRFLADPQTQAAVQRHKTLWKDTIEPMYKEAMKYDPNLPLPTRGLQTGARINLFRADENAVPIKKSQIVGRPSLLATFEKKSPFGVQATGTGPYGVNYREIIANTYARQLSIAKQNAFNKRLVESGNAVISKPGEQIEIAGEKTTPFPLKRTTFLKDEGKPFTKMESIYVRNSLAKEYLAAANPFGSLGGRLPAPVRALSTGANRMALAGLTDATVHLSNLATVLFTRPRGGNIYADILLSAPGRLDVAKTLVQGIYKALQDNSKQLGELAEIGALRGEHHGNFGLGPLISWADRTTRLVMDDTYKALAEKGMVENSETARREFVNQVGQYNARLQGQIVRSLRQSGISPFITAGRTFSTLGIRNMLLSPGVKGADAYSAALLRADVLSKWVGTLGLLFGMNYLLTKDKGGGVLGRPGVALGRLDSGLSDEDGRPLTLPFLDIAGFGRGLRITGVRGSIDAYRNGLPMQTIVDAGLRDMENSIIGPFAGPLPRAAVGAFTGYPTAVSVGRAYPVVPPGQSQRISDFEQAAIDLNPIIASIHDKMKTGGSEAQALARQLPRFTLQPSRAPEMMDDYADIVHRAQMYGYADDVVHRARKMPTSERAKYIEAELDKLEDTKDQQQLKRTLKQRKIQW